MVTYLLDTNVWIDWFNGNPVLDQRLAEQDLGKLRLSVIVRGELEVGYQLAGLQRERSQLDYIYSRIVTNVFTELVSEEYARITAQLRRAGTPIGVNDTWIAAEALAHGQTVVTANERDFRRVPGLNVENWMV